MASAMPALTEEIYASFAGVDQSANGRASAT
jgi:hypothetical protein